MKIVVFPKFTLRGRRWFFRIVAIDTARLILSQGKTATISVHADE